MVTDVDQTQLQASNRSGQLSKNMFFARHVAQPKFLKFITGTAGVRVCHVRDDIPHLPTQPSSDLARSLFTDPRFVIDFPPNSYNEALLRSYAKEIQPKRRRERILPPIKGWNVSGAVIADTEHWRRELVRIAEMVGLVTTDELSDIAHRKDPPPSRAASTSPMRRTPLRSANGEYSQRTGRWNETPKLLSRSRTTNRRTPLAAIVPNRLFCVEEQDREAWMLQVLCQILKTDDVNEIQSWLVSSTPHEKEAVRQLITSAIRGLEEGGRIEPSAYVDENAKGTQVNLDTFGSLMSNKFPKVPSDQAPPPLIIEKLTKPTSRSRTVPQVHPPASTASSKSTRTYPTNLEPINEEKNSNSNVPQPTTVDIKRDIQVLTLNDDPNQSEQGSKIEQQDEVPF